MALGLWGRGESSNGFHFVGGLLFIQDMGPHVWIVWMFGAFIVCCGLTHLINAIRPWAFVSFPPSFSCFLCFLV